MMNPLPRLSSFVALFALAPLTTAQTAAEDLAQRANQTLGLESSQLQVLPIRAEAGTLSAVLQLGNEPVFLDLDPHAVFVPDFKLYAQVEDGSLEQLTPAETRTYRGELVGSPGSTVAASLLDDGLYARILLADGREFWLEPIAARVAGARPEHHVLYSVDDVLPTNNTCAADLLSMRQDTLFVPETPQGSAPGPVGGSSLSIAELACDADFEYFQDYGSVANVQNRIGSVINTMNLQYESEVGISHLITAIVVRTSSNDPYTSNNAETLLNQFRNEWLANQGGVSRDVAHLFTGRSINGSTIGIAWLNAVCGSFAYGLVESDFNNNFSCATDLSAHELGHNWGAGHCSCTNFTMNSFITCANQFSPSATIPNINSFKNSINCLSVGNPTVAPTAEFTANVVSGEAPLTVNFTSLSSGDIDSYQWFFDLAGGSTAQNPSFTFEFPGTYFISLEVTGPAGSDTEFKAGYISVTPATGGNQGIFYLSFLSGVSIPGVGNAADDDIVAYDLASGTWSRYFDGSDVGLAGADIDAMHVSSDGSILMSFDQPFSIAGLIGGPGGAELVDDSDIVRFVPTSTGNVTAGHFEFFFDGSDVGLTTNGEDIDGLYQFSSGELLVSTNGAFGGTGFSGSDEDAVLFFPAQYGASTSGSWSAYFDGSDVGFGSAAAYDWNALSSDGVDLLFSTIGSYSAAGGSGADEDVSVFSGSFGSSTSGSATRVLDLSTLGIIASEDVDALSFAP